MSYDQEVTLMPGKATPIPEAARSLVAAAMDDGWDIGQIESMFKEAIRVENEARRDEEARRLYGPAAKSMDATPDAVAIVAEAKLPRGQYAITGPNEIAPVHKGTAVRAVEAAMATGETCRLYRLADGWRFVGIVHADGRFTDERAWGTDPRSWS